MNDEGWAEATAETVVVLTVLAVVGIVGSVCAILVSVAYKAILWAFM